MSTESNNDTGDDDTGDDGAKIKGGKFLNQSFAPDKFFVFESPEIVEDEVADDGDLGGKSVGNKISYSDGVDEILQSFGKDVESDFVDYEAKKSDAAEFYKFLGCGIVPSE